MTYISSPEALADARNRCVRLVDAIPLPACETHALVVTPLLYEHSTLPFRHIGELVEISIQLIEVFLSVCAFTQSLILLSASSSCTITI